jgi:hypothetical protein
VWGVLGALSQATSLPVTTAVLFEGRFRFGAGSGEALNEHILGDAWPEADTRCVKRHSTGSWGETRPYVAAHVQPWR